MKLIYISPLRYPSEKAGSAFSMKSCETFADLGYDVELWVPRRRNYIEGDSFSYHGVKKNFHLVKLPILDISGFSNYFFIILSLSFAVSLFIYALYRKLSSAILYSHEEFGLFLLTFWFPKTVYEIHDFPAGNPLQMALLKRVWKIVVTNNWKKGELIRRFGVLPEKILAIPNAVDVEQFANAPERSGARARLKLPDNERIIVYTGHLYPWKGVDTLFEAAKMFSKNALLYTVGGTEVDLKKYREKYRELGNVVFVGMRPHEEIPFWLRAADILVLPNTAKEDISKYYTSPMKLFEYMASGTPIVASDLPSVREVLDDRTGTFFEPDDSADLARAVDWVLRNAREAGEKAAAAREKAADYGWEKRADRVTSFLRG